METGKFKPLGDRILVKADEKKESTTKGGIIIAQETLHTVCQ